MHLVRLMKSSTFSDLGLREHTQRTYAWSVRKEPRTGSMGFYDIFHVIPSFREKQRKLWIVGLVLACT